MGTMTPISSRVKISTFLFILHLANLQAVHEVHEITNEQARSDSTYKGAKLPYGNPLAGNSQQSARLHAKNQQAMFNAERLRQHRAQIQRWTKAPLSMDSYVKAYHDSLDTHQQAVELMQAESFKDKKTITTPKPASKPRPLRRPETRDTLKRGVQIIPETIKITKDDAIKENPRSHRSHGSVRHHNQMQSKAYKSVYLSAAPTYDQGVTIKPNGNVGLTSLKSNYEEAKLYTAAVPSKARYIFPKRYQQVEDFESAKDTLTALLNKSPKEQMSTLNSIMNSYNTDLKSELETPINLYFYLNEPKFQTGVKNHENTDNKAIPTYASSYMPQAPDHIPITEHVIDIENVNREPKVKPYNLNKYLSAPAPATVETATKINDFYNVQVSTSIPEFKPIIVEDSSQPLKVDYGAAVQNYLKSPKTGTFFKSALDLSFEKPKPEVYSYSPPIENHYKSLNTDGDLSERYLHHNAQLQGVRHLLHDGKGVSAYDDNSLHYAANYEFGYRVRDLVSGNDFGHQEAQKEGLTNGQYHVLLPDGRLQKVQYSAGPQGFHADITYDHLKS